MNLQSVLVMVLRTAVTGPSNLATGPVHVLRASGPETVGTGGLWGWQRPLPWGHAGRHVTFDDGASQQSGPS
jgi:hypothetical protein